VYKAYRDNPEVRKEMVGWMLTTAGLGLPKSIGKPAAEAGPTASPGAPSLEISPVHPIFMYHMQWKLRVSGVALQTLAEEYEMPVKTLLTKDLNSTHFIKMAAKAKSSKCTHGSQRARARRPCSHCALVCSRLDT
jgi:hypothetical protein